MKQKGLITSKVGLRKNNGGGERELMGFSPWNVSVINYPKHYLKEDRKGTRGRVFLMKLGGSLCCPLFALLTSHLFPTPHYKCHNDYQTDHPTCE